MDIAIGILGLGTVGGGVARTLPIKSAQLAERLGTTLSIRRALIRDTDKPRNLPATLLTTDADDVLNDPAIDVVVEVIGGEEPAHSYIRRALLAGKHVVTANKEVIAKHGPALARLASDRGVALLYEASVGGGIPIIAVFQHDLSANNIAGIQAIINGTTNYILTRMANDGSEFADVLAEAQQLGYAEADPASDIDGYDAAYKLAILASLAFGASVSPDSVHREGIRGVTARDFRYAADFGYAIKLLAIAKATPAGVEVRVHPVLLARDRLLAKVDGVFNAVEVDGDLVGRVLFYGQGAGSLPTSSAIVADVLALATALGRGERPATFDPPNGGVRIVPIGEIVSRYYLRLVVLDRPGVLAQIAREFGDHGISIASVIQTASDSDAETAELVVMTHRAVEAEMQAALAAIRSMPVVPSIGSFLRVDG